MLPSHTVEPTFGEIRLTWSANIMKLSCFCGVAVQ